MSKNRELFLSFFGSEPAEVQKALLLEYIDTCGVANFEDWIRGMGLLPAIPPFGTPPAAPVQTPLQPLGTVPVQPQAYGFFGRSLDDAWIRSLTPLVGAETNGQLVVTFTSQWWAWATGVLAQTTAVAGVDPDGGLIAGFQAPFQDGCIAAIAVCNSPVGPWVDSLLRLPSGTDPTIPNISLPPRKYLNPPVSFEFAAPGAMHTLTLQ